MCTISAVLTGRLSNCAAEREALADCPNVQAYGRAIETERAGYLMRQWVASNLYDRIRCVAHCKSARRIMLTAFHSRKYSTFPLVRREAVDRLPASDWPQVRT